MKLVAHAGPPLERPFFDWEEDEDLDSLGDAEEIDLTDLLDDPSSVTQTPGT